MNEEVAYIKLPKVCRECGEFIYPPFNENLYIITKDNKPIEVCKFCHKGYKDSENMKYNINNLDEFKGAISPIKNEIQDIAILTINDIDNKIKELISPYIDIKATRHELIQLIDKSIYKLGHIVHIDYEEYYIVNPMNYTKDYFLTKHKVNLKEFKTWITISEIVRGIK